MLSVAPMEEFTKTRKELHMWVIAQDACTHLRSGLAPKEQVRAFLNVSAHEL